MYSDLQHGPSVSLSIPVSSSSVSGRGLGSSSDSGCHGHHFSHHPDHPLEKSMSSVLLFYKHKSSWLTLILEPRPHLSTFNGRTVYFKGSFCLTFLAYSAPQLHPSQA